MRRGESNRFKLGKCHTALHFSGEPIAPLAYTDNTFQRGQAMTSTCQSHM
jgi:hypothetical protein